MKKDNLSIIIFGGTGDLAEKKLIPSLYHLYKKGMLPENFSIVGFSRKDLSHGEYRTYMKESLAKKGIEGNDVSNFINHGFYVRGDLINIETYNNLANFLNDKDHSNNNCSNKLFYLAVSPRLYKPLFNNLSSSGLTTPCVSKDDDKNHWTRVLVEKPFGKDLDDAVELDSRLGELFNENQIFRIDHYLAKETIQNILTFRFGNSIFEPLWDKNSIESVKIKLYEHFGIRDRGAFYDGVGALRDVGQNHILQMLALVAMEDPKDLSAKSIRKSRANVLEEIVPAHRNLKEYAIRGQYDGYRHVEGVDDNSETETFFRIKLNIDNKKWKGVPFFIESGKGLKESGAEIEVLFKERDTATCSTDDNKDNRNKIIFRIQPDEGITIRFWSKKPGFDYELEEKDLSFNFADYDNTLPDAYERVLLDAIRGDQTLFASTEEVQAQWRFIMPICKDWNKTDLVFYKQGENPENITSEDFE